MAKAAIIARHAPQPTAPTAQPAQPAATGTPRTMWVEHIEDGTFAGGSEDAYHFDAREKGAEFLVIRKADYDRLLAQLSASRPTAEMVEACARELFYFIPLTGLFTNDDRVGHIAAILTRHFNPEKKP